MHPNLLPALLLLLPSALAQPAIPHPLPWQTIEQPAPPPQQQQQQQQQPSTHDALLPIVHERLQKPKDWAANGPAPSGEMDVSDEDLEFLTPKSHVTFGRDDNSVRQWFSPLGSTFKTFMDSMKSRNADARAEQLAAEEGEEAGEGEGVQRRAIPSMLSKGKKTQPEPAPEPAPEPEQEPEQQAAEEESDSLELSEVAITNEEFDQLFKDYASRYERAQTFQGLQGHLDTILLPGSGSGVDSKPWKQRRPGSTLARRNGGGSGSGGSGGGGSSGNSPSYLWTPESEKVGVRPVSSINPDIFNRIAAEYRFGQDPTSINQEEINVVGMVGAAGKQQAPQQRGAAAGGSKGKAAGAKGRQARV